MQRDRAGAQEKADRDRIAGGARAESAVDGDALRHVLDGDPGRHAPVRLGEDAGRRDLDGARRPPLRVIGDPREQDHPPALGHHVVDAREGGAFRISLTYDAPTGIGKTSAHTDTYHGRFVKLVADEQVVEVVEFETADPALRGEMTITIALAEADGGTDVLAVHDGLPRGVPAADNEAGWRSSLAKLAALVEAG